MARLDRVVLGYKSAERQVDYAVSKLNLANHDLNNTTLVAPFGGVISGKTVDPGTANNANPVTVLP